MPLPYSVNGTINPNLKDYEKRRAAICSPAESLSYLIFVGVHIAGTETKVHIQDRLGDAC